MKKIVRPSFFRVIFSGALTVICVADLIVETIRKYGISAINAIITLMVAGVFTYYLLDLLTQDKIYFDENTFTVKDKSYRFSEITRVEADNEHYMGHISRLKLKIYVGEEYVARFSKSDPGARALIEEMKNHQVTITVDG